MYKYIVDRTAVQRSVGFDCPVKSSVPAMVAFESVNKAIEFFQCVNRPFQRRIVRQFLPVGFQSCSCGQQQQESFLFVIAINEPAHFRNVETSISVADDMPIMGRNPSKQVFLPILCGDLVTRQA